MPPPARSERKKDARKEELKLEIERIQKLIEKCEMRALELEKYKDLGSSSSDEEFTYKFSEKSEEAEKLRQLQDLDIFLTATLELTDLEVKSYSEKPLAVAPNLDDREETVDVEGSWSEVNAECRVSCVPFQLSFYYHTAGPRAARLVRGLRARPLRVAHARELLSVALAARTPAQLVAMLSEYATAFISRRSSLLEILDKFGHLLTVESPEDGGCVLSCPNVLEVTWRLNNQSSPYGPFRHRMVFNIDYIDKKYYKIVREANKEISKPISTEKRTELLIKIINTCLRANGIEEGRGSHNSQSANGSDKENSPVDENNIRYPLDTNEPAEELDHIPTNAPRVDNSDATSKASKNEHIFDITAKSSLKRPASHCDTAAKKSKTTTVPDNNKNDKIVTSSIGSLSSILAGQEPRNKMVEKNIGDTHDDNNIPKNALNQETEHNKNEQFNTNDKFNKVDKKHVTLKQRSQLTLAKNINRMKQSMNIQGTKKILSSNVKSNAKITSNNAIITQKQNRIKTNIHKTSNKDMSKQNIQKMKNIATSLKQKSLINTKQLNYKMVENNKKEIPVSGKLKSGRDMSPKHKTNQPRKRLSSTYNRNVISSEKRLVLTKPANKPKIFQSTPKSNVKSADGKSNVSKSSRIPLKKYFK